MYKKAALDEKIYKRMLKEKKERRCSIRRRRRKQEIAVGCATLLSVFFVPSDVSLEMDKIISLKF